MNQMSNTKKQIILNATRLLGLIVILFLSFAGNAQSCSLCPPDGGGEGSGSGEGEGGGTGGGEGTGDPDGSVGGIVVTISGNQNVAKGSTWTYTVGISQDTFGSHSGSTYDVSSGATIISQTDTTVTVRWDLWATGEMAWVKVRSEIFSAYYHSDKLYVTVFEQLNPGLVAQPASNRFCKGIAPPRITNTLQASGGLSEITYKWKKYIGGVNTTDFVTTDGILIEPALWVDASGTNEELYYDPPSLNSNSTFIRQSDAGPGQRKYSNAITYLVEDPDFSAGTVTYAGEEVLPGGTVDIIEGSPLEETLTYQWQKKGESDNSFIDIEGEVTKDYDPVSLSESTVFRRNAYSTACDMLKHSNEIVVTVVDLNYVKQQVYTIPMTPADAVTTDGAMRETITYFDGIGRTKQVSEKGYSPAGFDLVQVFEYDDKGRIANEYLPYVVNSSTGEYQLNALTEDYASSDQSQYYQSLLNGGTSKAYASKKFEESPLNRVVEQGSFGESWQPNGTIGSIKYKYHSNKANEVLYFDFEEVLTGTSSYWHEGELSGVTTIDEDGNETVEFTNQQGKTVLKQAKIHDSSWAKTYYIYDKYNQLRIVIPPEASVRLSESFYAAGINRSDFLNRWAFMYEYDERGRMTVKKVPGSDTVYMVYDQWDRLILTQDGVQRSNQEWLFTKYDVMGRPVVTGIMNGSDVAKERDSVRLSNQQYEVVDTQSETGYSSLTYPREDQVKTYLTVTHYDDYDFQSMPQWASLSFTFIDPNGQLIKRDNVKGQVSGTMTKTGSGSWIYSVNFYDQKYRLIQSVSSNHIGGTDRITNYYDFIGQVTKSITHHEIGGNEYLITRTYGYDHRGRLVDILHQVGDQDPVLLSTNTYNERGELIEKNLHGIEGTYAQSIDYTYNIRGWLTSINKKGLPGSPVNDDPNDLFSMELIYHTLIEELSNIKN